MMAQAREPEIPEEARTWLAAGGLAVKATYRVDEVARLLSIGERTVYKMISRGQITPIDVAGTTTRSPTRIPITSLIALLDLE